MNEPDWEALRAFHLVAEAGSFTKAAERMSCAVSTVMRRIDGLEQTLGLNLLHRAQAGAVPTEVGKTILESIDQASHSLGQITRQARQFHHFRDRQTIRISATETAINDILIPKISKLRPKFPKLLLEFESSNALASLEFGETDIAVRLAKPHQLELITRKLPPIRMAIFISAAQLAERDLADVQLREEPAVWIDSGLGDIAENRLIDQLGIGENMALRATSVRALALACVHGEGLALLPTYMGRDQGLIEVPHISVPHREAWLVSHPETKRDPVLRAVRRWVVECFEKIA